MCVSLSSYVTKNKTCIKSAKCFLYVFCFLCVLEPDPVFDSYLQGPAPVTANVEQATNSNKDIALTSTSGTGQGNFDKFMFKSISRFM